MNNLTVLTYLIAISALCISQIECVPGKMVCYYDADSFDRPGRGQFALEQLEKAVPLCDYLVYGYVGIDPTTFQLNTLNVERDIERKNFESFLELKKRYPQVKFLLSIGGNKDKVHPSNNQYFKLLDSAEDMRSFINCTLTVLQYFGFDGLDLAWQFASSSMLPKVYRPKFRKLMRDLSSALGQQKRILTLTILPNTNIQFIDIVAIERVVEYFNLAAFDFVTPDNSRLNPRYPALLQRWAMKQERTVQSNISLWLRKVESSHKLVLGIPAFGRAWSTTAGGGPAPAGPRTQIPGLLSWPEICDLKRNNRNTTFSADPSILKNPVQAVYNAYAWVGYENPQTAAMKTFFAITMQLKGVALFDLSLDDFRDDCVQGDFSILRKMRQNLS